MKKPKLSERLAQLFGFAKTDASVFDELEDALIEADIGALLAASYVSLLKNIAGEKGQLSAQMAQTELARLMAIDLLEAHADLVKDAMNVFMVCGVNGVGKTTTIGKLAHHFSSFVEKGQIILAAADTFRAAAIDQIVIWGERLGCRVIRQKHGADPGAVVYDTLDSASARGTSVVIIDTSGRMHTKDHLIKELEKMDRIVRSKLKNGDSYRKMIVLDATTGQNALAQAEVFHKSLGIDSAILAKYDSTAKGGIAVAIGRALRIPFSFIGRGEKAEDLEIFDKVKFLESLFS
ncbi:MAG: signal recognition particle-docking protein FtsY [Spirochaetaceae bacterium]|nr:MAG: signal recognition particle-docking protein FtsY [Spirochaetaceae bacterium]